MSNTVTIVGSDSPSAYLARGERRTVQRTAQVDRWIDAGFVVVVDDADDAIARLATGLDVPTASLTDLRTDEQRRVDEDAQRVRDELGVPSRGGSTEDWQKFLASKGIAFNDDDQRAVLIDRWDHYDAGSSAPTE